MAGVSWGGAGRGRGEVSFRCRDRPLHSQLLPHPKCSPRGAPSVVSAWTPGPRNGQPGTQQRWGTRGVLPGARRAGGLRRRKPQSLGEVPRICQKRQPW